MRGEMLLAEVAPGDRRRCTVASGNRDTVTHIVLQARADVVRSDVVRVFALETFDGGNTHLGIHIRILTVVFPHTRPARVATEVEHRGVSPRNVRGTRLVGRDFSSALHEVAVERRTHVHTLREHRAVLGVRRAVDLVHTVDTWDTDFFHRNVLNLLDGLSPNFFLLGNTEGDVEDRADFVLPDDCIEHRLAHFESVFASREVGDDIDGDFTHLPDFFFQRHLL